ncbi:transposase for insertion sequence element [Corynebacterium variabile DSM 44702]|uniref:Transposase for insertion sequence element n=1 Tax=Corynebacterium variabile (strain DSM 44702 / CIP 107183 / JCM 12073 / NCIMB 30131) TaxID=858619 RepID=G0HGE0_CORVD|nr:transposase for insertion sequence element [Corynebacterium variabile DSM 44702]
MALNPQGSYADVLDQLTDGLSWASGWQDIYQPPSPAAVVQARRRLGSSPLRLLFDRVAGPVADIDTPGTFLASRRMAPSNLIWLNLARIVHLSADRIP